MFAKQPPPVSNNLFPATQAPHQLMQHQMKAANTLTAPPISIPQTSPLSPVPPPLDQHLLFQHQAAVANKQLRLSLLPAGKKFVVFNYLLCHSQEILREENFVNFKISCRHSNK